MTKAKKKFTFIFSILLLCIITVVTIAPVSASGVGRYYPTLTYAICSCNNTCEKCMVQDENSQNNDNIHCKFQGISACECKCKITKLTSYSTTNSHIWTDESSAIITAVQKDSKNNIVNSMYIQIGKTLNNDKNVNERNCYYYIVGKKDKTGKVVFDANKRKIGQYYIQEMFELNRTTENKYKLYITLPKAKLFTNGFYRVYGKININGNNCSIIKTNDNPLFVNFDDSNSNTTEYKGSSHITIRNMTVNCTYKSDENINHYRNGFLYVAHCSNILVDNVTVQNGRYNGHVIQITGATNVQILNSSFKNFRYLNRDNNKVYTRDNCYNKKEKNTDVSGNSIYNHEVIQIEPDYSNTSNGQTYAVPTIKMSNDDTISRNVTIENCKFENIIRAIGTHSTRGKICHHIKIKNNIFVDVVGHGIVLPKDKFITVCNNLFNKVSTKQIGGSLVYYVKYGEVSTITVKENLFFNVHTGCESVSVVDFWNKKNIVNDDTTDENMDSMNK